MLLSVYCFLTWEYQYLLVSSSLLAVWLLVCRPGSFLLNLETLQGASDARVLWSLWRLLQPIRIIWRLLIRQRSWEAAGQQEKSGISKANRCATVLPAYAINPKSPTVDEDALFWWHADVSFVRFQLDFGDFDFVQSQLGWKRQDNDQYSRVTQKKNPYTSYKFQHNLQLFKHQFSCFFNRKLTQCTFFHTGFLCFSLFQLPGGAEVFGFQTDPYTCTIDESKNAEADLQPVECNRQWKSFSIHWPLCYFLLSQLCFFLLSWKNPFYHCQRMKG